jgi:hypothetical protein
MLHQYQLLDTWLNVVNINKLEQNNKIQTKDDAASTFDIYQPDKGRHYMLLFQKQLISKTSGVYLSLFLRISFEPSGQYEPSSDEHEGTKKLKLNCFM